MRRLKVEARAVWAAGQEPHTAVRHLSPQSVHASSCLTESFSLAHRRRTAGRRVARQPTNVPAHQGPARVPHYPPLLILTRSAAVATELETSGSSLCQ